MTAIGTLSGPWLVCAAFALLAVVARRSVRPAAAELWLIAVLTAGALAARLGFGVWGPLHVNGQGPLWISGTLDADALSGYGPGYYELFNWVTRLGMAPDTAVFAANAVLSALSPALLYAVARLIGVERGAAVAIAVVLAADAVSVRTAASEGYFSSLIALVLAVQLALAWGVRARLRHDRLATALSLGAAALLAAATARIHPMGYLPLALSPLVVLGAAPPQPWQTRVLRTVVAAAVIAAVVVITSGGVIVTALHAPMAGRASNDLVRRAYHLVLLVGLLATLWSVRRWLRFPWLPVLGMLSLVVMMATQDSVRNHPLQTLSYQRLFWPAVLLGATPLWPRRLQTGAWALVTAAVVVVALLVPAMPYLGIRTTEQLEYGFLREALRDMPRGCTLAGVSHAGTRVWAIPSYLMPDHGLQASRAQRAVERSTDLAVAPGDCLLYVRSSLCTSAEARALCERVEREVGLERLSSRVFPALPSFVQLPYDRSEVEVVVFRVAGRGTMTSNDIPITPAFAQALYDRLTRLAEPDGCRVVGLDTSRFRITVDVKTAASEGYPLELAPAPHRAEGSQAPPGWALVGTPALENSCGATLAAIERVLAATEHEVGP